MGFIDKWLSKLSASFLAVEYRNNIKTSRGNFKSEYPSDFLQEEIELIQLARAKTMTSHERMVALIHAVDYLEKHKIEGDFVECGVWKGGSMLIAGKRLLHHNSTSRNLFLFDTFEGMSNPTDHDISAVENEKASDLLDKFEKTSGDNIWCYSTEQEVAKTMSDSGYPTSKIHLIKGKVEDTLPHKSVNKIALLRLDTDWYESTKHELETLYDLLVPGGILIIDDYGHWSGARKAVDEFIEKRHLKLFLNRIDYTGRIAIKN